MELEKLKRYQNSLMRDYDLKPYQKDVTVINEHLSIVVEDLGQWGEFFGIQVTLPTGYKFEHRLEEHNFKDLLSKL